MAPPTAATRTPVQAACHCRGVRFEATLTDGLNTARRCDCSLCRMRGAVVVSAEADGVRIVAGEQLLSEYRFNTKTAKHYFCSTCGIYTHHQRRSDPHQFGVNVACIEGASPFDFARVPVNDGVHHPSDLGPGAKPRLAGVLHYEAYKDA
ncbi:MAG: GFA family protein [Caulobacteraceae bacterium]|nr:GFA family protein [Caulobacter sp.]